MTLPKHSVVCGDDYGIVPSHIEHTPAFLLNPKADPLVLLSAAHARLMRIRHALEIYTMLPNANEHTLPDATSLHQHLMALHHQTEEICQILEASVERLRTLPDTR